MLDENLVDTAGVHKEVCVDFHDRLYWTLGPDLVHDVLQHCPSDHHHHGDNDQHYHHYDEDHQHDHLLPPHHICDHQHAYHHCHHH